MDYIKIRFGRDLERLQSELERSIEHMFRTPRPMFALSGRTWKPQIDIFETQEEIIIIGEIAGVLQEDLLVEVDSRAVKISGTRAEPGRDSEATFHLAEIPCGPFERNLLLPTPVDPSKVRASCSNGILQIRLTKQTAGRTHSIPIQAS